MPLGSVTGLTDLIGCMFFDRNMQNGGNLLKALFRASALGKAPVETDERGYFITASRR